MSNTKGKTTMYCPVCNNGKNFVLIEKCTAAFSSEIVNYRIYQCNCCDSSFADPLKSAPEDYYNYSVPEWRWEFGELIQDLNNLILGEFKLLEIGCNEGNFLKGINTNKYSVYGIDFNQKAINKARDKELNCHALTIDEFKTIFPGLRFDIICFFHVLEHVENPYSFLEAVKSLLNPNGKIIFSVPHPHRLRLLADREEADYPPNHLVRFTIRGLQYLVERSGLKILEMKDHPKELNLFSFTALSSYSLLKKLGMAWTYKPFIPKWFKALIRTPFYLAIFPYASFRFLTNLHLTGDAIYVVCEMVD
jgi:2-polyprenyl-3-methyl-5-hydroxy-6-metoxy-1,4-benzoquinol methylase